LWLAPTQHHAANLLKAFFHFEIKIDKILESAKFLTLQAPSMDTVHHTVCRKNIHDSKIPAKNYHKILVHGRKNWAHSTLSQQKTRKK
jgi:hypothetical protein